MDGHPILHPSISGADQNTSQPVSYIKNYISPTYYATRLVARTATLAPAAFQRPRVSALAGVINVSVCVVGANYFFGLRAAFRRRSI